MLLSPPDDVNDRLFLGTNLGRDIVGRAAVVVEGAAVWMEAETAGVAEMDDTAAACGDFEVVDVICSAVEI